MTYYVYLPFPKKSPDLTVNDKTYSVAAYDDMVFLKSNLSFNGRVELSADDDAEGSKKMTLHDRGHFRDKKISRFGRLKKARRVLSVVQPDDVLVINGHGGTGAANHLIAVHMDRFVDGTKVGSKPELHAFTADVLAERMEKEGLPKNVVNIAVKICYSGVEASNPAAAAAIGQADTTSCCFASLLAYYLGRRGYRRIEVVGYTGETTAIAKGGSAGSVAIKMKVNEEEEERYVLFPLWRKSRVFDHTGRQIAGESVAGSRLS